MDDQNGPVEWFTDRRRQRAVPGSIDAYNRFFQERITNGSPQSTDSLDTWQSISGASADLVNGLIERSPCSNDDLTEFAVKAVRIEREDPTTRNRWVWRTKWSEGYDIALSGKGSLDIGTAKSEALFAVAHTEGMSRMLSAPKWRNLIAGPFNKEPYNVFMAVEPLDALDIMTWISNFYDGLLSEASEWPDPLPSEAIDWTWTLR